MQEPYTPAHEEHGMICPTCGTKNVSKDITSELKIGDKPLIRYICGDCKETFIPAMLGKDTQNNVQKWANKMATKMELNEGINFKKEDQVIITMKEVPLMEGVAMTRNEFVAKVMEMLAQDKAFTKQSLIREVTLDLISQDVSKKKNEKKVQEEASIIVGKLLGERE
jgi:uncharacterized Zn finger protein